MEAVCVVRAFRGWSASARRRARRHARLSRSARGYNSRTGACTAGNRRVRLHHRARAEEGGLGPPTCTRGKAPCSLSRIATSLFMLALRTEPPCWSRDATGRHKRRGFLRWLQGFECAYSYNDDHETDEHREAYEMRVLVTRVPHSAAVPQRSHREAEARLWRVDATMAPQIFCARSARASHVRTVPLADRRSTPVGHRP